MASPIQCLFLFAHLALSMAISAMESKHPLHHAALTEDLFGMHVYLLDRNPEEVDIQSDAGLTALMTAVIAGKRYAVEDLVVLHGANVALADQQGRTALHYAASKGFGKPKHRKKIAYFLLKHGAPIDAQTHIGITPLHQAVLEGQNWVAIALMTFGANKLLIDTSCNRPYDYALARNNRKLIDYINTALAQKGIEGEEQKDSSETAARRKFKMLHRLRYGPKKKVTYEIASEDAEEESSD